MRTGVHSGLLQVSGRPDIVDLRTVTFRQRWLRRRSDLRLHLPDGAPVPGCRVPLVRMIVILTFLLVCHLSSLVVMPQLS